MQTTTAATTRGMVLLAGVPVAYVAAVAGGAFAATAILISLSLALLGVARANAAKSSDHVALVSRAASVVLGILPGALVLYLAFNAGGFFPLVPALLAVGLLVTAALRVLLVRRPGAGLSRPLIVAGCALATYTLWVLLSAVWSLAPWRALVEFDLALLYTLAVVVMGSLPASDRRLRWQMRTLALACLTVSLAALTSRVLPSLWPISSDLYASRLTYPVTYPNALGMIAAIGVILCTALTTSVRETRATRVLAAAALPLLAATLLLTFSRGAIAAAIIGLAAYLLLGPRRALLTGLPAVVPTIIAVRAAYRANLLAAPMPGHPGLIEQGHHLALTVALCCVAAGSMRLVVGFAETRLGNLSPPRPGARWIGALARSASLAAALTGLLTLGAPQTIAREYGRFVHGSPAGPQQVRDRLTNVGGDQRLQYWRVALAGYRSAPLTGGGAGTYALLWAARRPTGEQVLDAHSLYFENLAELGLVGTGLLALALGAIFGGLATRIRGSDRALPAGAFAVALAWAVHAGVDWDWEMPAVSLPIFLLAGTALARPASARPNHAARSASRRARRTRMAAALALLGLAALPAAVGASQTRMNSALTALGRGDCRRAGVEARAALDPLAVRADAHEVLGYCAAARGQWRPAQAEMDRAVHSDPQSWEPRYGRAIVRGAAGLDPRAAIREAVALNPGAVNRDAAARFLGAGPTGWRSDAQVASVRIAGDDYPDLLELGQRAAGNENG